MIVLTGGAFSGKSLCAREIYRSLGHEEEPVVAEGADCTLEECKKADIWDHFPLWVKRGMKEERDLAAELEEILDQNPDLIVVTQELGCGLVPVDASERAFREKNGRLSCDLAARAEEVYLVTCGLPRQIKGQKTV